MTDTQRAINAKKARWYVASTLYMFAERYGWDKLDHDEKALARLAEFKQTNPRYMDLYD
jgi:hypothetical protein